jgi:hypothetical protein
MLQRPLLATIFPLAIQNRCNSIITSNAVRIFQTDYGDHPASYTMDTSRVFLGIKQTKLEVEHLDAGLLARSQYPEGPATGHLDTGFSCFPCV